MLKKIIIILISINILKANKIILGYQNPIIANGVKLTNVPSYNKNIEMDNCIKKVNNINTQINSQQINLSDFQNDPNYYKKTSNPVECVEKINQNLQKATSAASETFNKVLLSEKNLDKKCLYTMDKKSNNCFITKFLDQIITHPMWNIVLHLNVIQIFYGTKLRKMIIFENFNYVIKNSVKSCITRFKNATAIAKHNAFGSVLEFIGDLPKEQKIECTPCSIIKQNKMSNISIEGQNDLCSSCDPFSQLMGYQSHITENTSIKIPKVKTKNSKKNGNFTHVSKK